MKISIFQAFGIFGAVAKVMQDHPNLNGFGVDDAVLIGESVLGALGKQVTLNGVPVPVDMLGALVGESIALVRGDKLSVSDLMLFVTRVCNRLGIVLEFEK